MFDVTRTLLHCYLWQAKHDKSGLSWKSPIESQWSMCEIEKSLCEIGKSLREITKSLYEKLKLLYENEKLSCEIIITNREWKTAMWDYSLMQNRFVRKRNHHSRLSIGFFLSRWEDLKITLANVEQDRTFSVVSGRFSNTGMFFRATNFL